MVSVIGNSYVLDVGIMTYSFFLDSHGIFSRMPRSLDF